MDPILTVDNLFVNESGIATLTFRLSATSALQTSVNFYTSTGSAGSGDFTDAAYRTLIFAPNQLTQTVQVPITTDTTAEGNEYFQVLLDTPVGLVIDNPRSTVTIVDNDRGDRAPVASVEDVTVDESDGFARFNIILDRVSNVPVTVNYTTTNGSATGGADFVARTGFVTFAAGQTVQTVAVQLTNDTTGERAETFSLDLTGISGVTGALLGARRATATIGTSDGSTAGTPFVTVDPVTVSEGDVDGMAEITLRLSAASTAQTSVRAYTSTGNAGSADFDDLADYNIVFAAGETTKTILVPIDNDATAEGTEYFQFLLYNPVGLVIDNPRSVVTIIDNDQGDRPPIASVDDVTVDETDGFARFTIILDRVSNLPVTVSYTTGNNSATGGSDFTSTTGSVTFAPGQTAQTIAVALTNDTVGEAAETFFFDLTGITGVSGALLGARRATATIGTSDGSTAGTAFVTVDPVTVSEGDVDGMAEITLRLSAASAAQTSVRAYTSTGNAGSADFDDLADYNIVFAPGETTKTILVPIDNDTAAEGIEYFQFLLYNPVGLVIDNPRSVVTIIDNDQGERAPFASVEDVTVDETDVFARFNINLDRVSNQRITVTYETIAGTAGTSDFTPATGTLILNPGDTSGFVNVALQNDTLAEGAEAFQFRITGISGVTNAAVADGIATATIGRSDGTTAGTPTLSVAALTVSEGSAIAKFQLTLSAASAVLTSVRAYTSTATAGSADFDDLADYNIVFAPGETTKTILVPIDNDGVAEPTETFTFQLYNPSGLTLAQTAVTATIIDDDPSQVSIAAVSPERAEGLSGATPFTFLVARSGALNTTQTVTWTVQPSGATPATAADFQNGVFPSGTVTFAPNQTLQTVTVNVLGDSVIEASEGFQVRLSAPSAGLVLGNALAQSVILDDDSATTLTGTANNDTLIGTPGANTINALAGNDSLSGLAGNDTMNGGDGNDILTGGIGADLLTGGLNADTFIFTTASDSIVALAGRDTIADFSTAQLDKISLTAIDANTLLAGNQAFTLTADDFTGVVGQISIARWGTKNSVFLDTNGDGVADAAFTVTSSATLTVNDFLL